MKQTICAIVAILFLLFLCSCGNNNIKVVDPVNFYYCTPETQFGEQNTLMVAQIREAKDHTQDYPYLISQYLNGPITYDCVSPFPGGTTLEEFAINDFQASIVLSPHIATLSGSELMLACACMTKTVIEMTGVDTVQISTSEGTLNGEDFIVLTADSFAYQ